MLRRDDSLVVQRDNPFLIQLVLLPPELARCNRKLFAIDVIPPVFLVSLLDVGLASWAYDELHKGHGYLILPGQLAGWNSRFVFRLDILPLFGKQLDACVVLGVGDWNV